jgi:Ser/Thr protein kinase RdoA (MazF antagonist)
MERPTSAPDEASQVALRALERFGLARDAELSRFGRGLINQTFRARTSRGALVLQRLNAIFDPAIHHNIEVVTRRLAGAGIETPELVRTTDGQLWADLGAEGHWRLMTLVDGVSFDTVRSPSQAHSAGELVGRFHRALATLDHPFVGLRLGVHDTAQHLESLRAAMAGHPDHRLRPAVGELGAEILDAASLLPRLDTHQFRYIGHGDLKLNNILFAAASGPRRDQALALIDLDTVGPIAIGHELGDAWRSWCNPAGEDSAAASFDLPIFERAWRGYEAAAADLIGPEARQSLLFGPEWVSLELAARFAADALVERYFGWDSDRHPTRGDHNLARARSQWAVHRAAVRCRAERAALLGVAIG